MLHVTEQQETESEWVQEIAFDLASVSEIH